MYARVYPSLATRTRFNKPEIPKPFNLFLSKIRNKDSSGNRLQPLRRVPVFYAQICGTCRKSF